MDKRTLKHLERVFACEIEGRMAQLHPRTMEKLALARLVTLEEERIAVFPLGMMTIKGCRLTHAGRMAYCETCTDDPDL